MNPIILKNEIKNNSTIKNVFLPTQNNWKSLEDSKLTVWESGEKQLLFKRIVDLIKKAAEIICLQSFLIQDTEIIDELLNASKKGIKVYVMDSAEARLGEGKFDEEESFATTEYTGMINKKFRYHFIHRQAKNFHAKFILIDPKSKNAEGVLFTGNFNKKPFEKNPELGVELNKNQVEELFQVFVYHFWEYAADEQTATEEFYKLAAAKKFNRPILNQVLVTSPDEKLSNLKNTLLDKIQKANQSIYFSTFGFDINNDVSKAILNKLNEGIDVTVFCRAREKAIRGNLDVLASKGANVFCHELIHAKSIVVDNKWGAIFSANFETHGMDEGFETGVGLDGKHITDLLKIYQSWEKNFPYIFKAEMLFSELPHQYAQIKDEKLALFIALSEETQIGAKKTVDNLNELIAYLDNEVKPNPSKAKKIIQEKEVRLKNLNITNFSKRTPIVGGVELIEYEEVVKQKKEEKTIVHKVLLMDNSITDENLKSVVTQLKEKKLDNYKVYMS